MQISHILLRNFGKFENFSCDFRPGLNLIKGPNEAGKTTLANAITAALFVDPANSGEAISKETRWGTTRLPALEAVLDVDGKSIRLIKDFQLRKSELDTETMDLSGIIESVEGWLESQLGMPSEEIFKATACIQHGEINRIEDSFAAIKDKLESLVTGGKEEKAASINIAKIEKRIQEIAGDDGVGGELARLNKQADDINYNIDKLTREINALKTKRSDLIQVEMALKNVREDLNQKKEKLEKSRKANKLDENSSDTARELQEIKTKVEESQEALKKIKGLRDRQAGLKGIDPRDLQDLNALETSLNYLQPKRHELQEEATEAREEYETFQIGGAYIAAAGLGALGCIAFVVSYFTEFLGFLNSFAIYGALGSLAVLGFGMALTISRKQHKGYLQERAEKLEGKLTEHDIELQKQNAALSVMLTKYSVHTPDELRRSLWQFDDIEKQIGREKELYEGLLEGRTQQELEKAFQALQNAMDYIRKQKKELSQYIIDDDEFGRQALVVSQFEERLKDLERERTVLLQQIETAEGGAELLASYTERRENLRLAAEKMLHDVAVLRLTSNCIDEARQNVLVSALEVLNNRTSDIVSHLTSGRYSRVRFDKSTMRFEIFCEERQKWVAPENGLSLGTSEQVYLAARLALAEVISDNKNSVMILDDPFTNYDEKRLESAMRVIKEISQNRQVLLLTSQNHYDQWADCTISL
jgi:DNA repair exonuclease SbcCD ATPase subunit